MKIYLAKPISGTSYEATNSYFENTAAALEKLGFKVLSPLTGKEHLRTETHLRAHGYANLASTDHAIIERDFWMLKKADIVYANLEGAPDISIGTTMELGWAYELRKHTVVALEPGGIHEHAFILEAADIRATSHAEAMDYLKKLSPRRNA